ncbi:MAG: allantoinase [Phycisphaerales bacterium]
MPDTPTYSLAYGLRLVPAADLDSVEDARWTSTGGDEGRITMHLIEGDLETIKARLHDSIDAFFELVAPASEPSDG